MSKRLDSEDRESEGGAISKGTGMVGCLLVLIGSWALLAVALGGCIRLFLWAAGL